MYNPSLLLPESAAALADVRETIKPPYASHDQTAAKAAVSAAAAAVAQQYPSDTAAERAAVLTEVSVHSARVALYTWHLARAIESGGRRIGDGDAKAELLALAALVHDIGKFAVSAHLLAKPCRLTPEEFECVQAHPLHGARIIDSMASRIANPLRRVMVEVCECHHERWNGSGYPGRRVGGQIPYGARVVSVCDTYDAIVHDRVYAKRRSHDTAMQIISDGRGVLFDPDIVEAMLAVGPVFRELKMDI